MQPTASSRGHFILQSAAEKKGIKKAKKGIDKRGGK
jgi:hypothetical protein